MGMDGQGNNNNNNNTNIIMKHPGRSEQWEKSYKQALDYFNRNGTCIITNTHMLSSELKTLNAWISRQRKKISNPNDKSLSTEQKLLLCQIQIKPYQHMQSQNGLDDKWETKYQQVLKYYNEHGHCKLLLLLLGFQ